MENNITILDEITINKIAAGEVVERPASIVKELIENSIDAGANQIQIEIKDGGKELIKISDDGYGISADQIELAFTRHATSKIYKIEDVQTLNTNGFRGEALSSISSVSKIDIITNTSNDSFGVKAKIIDSTIREISEIGARKGTTISVADLFYNTPARKKFLKSGSREAAVIIDIVNRLALVNSFVKFKLISDGKELLSTGGDGSLLNVIRTVYGKNVTSNLIKIECSNQHIKVRGYISNTSLYTSSRKKQNIFINKRYIKLNKLNYVIENAYKEMIPIGKYPVFILDIEILPEFIDPNIHPSKTEVKVDDEVLLDDFINNNVRDNIFKSSENLIPHYKIKDSGFISLKENLQVKSGFVYEQSDKIEEEFVVKQENNVEDIEIPFSKMIEQIKSHSDSDDYESEIIQTEIIEGDIFDYNSFISSGVVFETYIVATYKGDMYLIDQHAAHERIMYEKFMYQYNLNKEHDNLRFESQELLIPVIKELTMDEYLVVVDNKDIFDFFGLKIDDFGFGNIAIRSLPLIFNTEQTSEFFEELKDIIIREGKIDLNDKFRDKLATMACKKAIKANQKIEIIEIESLFQKLNKCENKYTCPHGRPIFVKFTKYEIEKMFKRKNA